MLKKHKFYFMGETLVRVLHISTANDQAVIFNFAESAKQTVSLPGARLVFTPALKIGEVAKIFGCHPDTIRKWEAKEYIGKPAVWEIGPGKKFRFYTLNDVKEMRDAVAGIHRGRPRNDKLITNKCPSQGSIRQIVRDISRRYNVDG